MPQDAVNYTDSDPLAHGIKRRMSSSDEHESDIMASDELGVVTVEVVAGNDDNNKKVKVHTLRRILAYRNQENDSIFYFIILSRLNQTMNTSTVRPRIIFLDASRPTASQFRI